MIVGDPVQRGGEDGGKRVYYALRWINTRGQTGPWSHDHFFDHCGVAHYLTVKETCHA